MSNQTSAIMLTRFSLLSGAFAVDVAGRSRWNNRSRPATLMRILSASIWAPLWAAMQNVNDYLKSSLFHSNFQTRMEN